MSADGSRKVEVVIEGDPDGGIEAMDAIDRRGRGLGSMFGGLGRTAGLALGGIAIGAGIAGAALFSIGDEMDAARDSIQIATGAVGTELDSLTSSFEGVFTSVPTDSETAATAIGMLNSRLDLTGQALEERSSQFLELSRITGTDLASNVESISRVFGDWSIATEGQGAAMDALFRASQETGAGVDSLASGVVQFGAPLRQLGFGFEESIAMLGKFEAEGVNTELVLGSMRQALGRMARAGEEPIETFSRVTDEIKNAGSAGEANAIALELFGARAGPDMAAAIREGRFELGGLYDDIANGEGTILGAAAETRDFSENWQVFTNKAKVAIEPLASAIFNGLGDALTKVTPYLEQAVEWLGKLGDVIKSDGLGAGLRMIGDAFRDAWPNIKAQLNEWAIQLGAWWLEQWPGIRTKLGELITAFGEWVVEVAPIVAEKLVAWGSALLEWVLPQIPPLLEKLGHLLSTVGQWILDEGLPLLQENLGKWADSFATWLGDNWAPYARQMGALLLRLGDWIVTEAAPTIRGKLLEWARTFLEWVATDVIPQIPGKLWELANTIGAWIRDEATPWLAAKAKELGLALLAKITEGAIAGVEWLGSALSSIPGLVSGAFSSAITWLKNAGLNIIQGLWDGIKEKWEDMTSWLSDKVDAFTDLITNPLDILSPSRVMMDVGRNIGAGLAIGLEDSIEGDVEPVLTSAADRIAGVLSGSSPTSTQAGPTATYTSTSSAARSSSSSRGGRSMGRPLVVQLVTPSGRVMAEELIPALLVIGEEELVIPDR